MHLFWRNNGRVAVVISASPKAVMTANMPMLDISDVSRWVEVKVDHDCTKSFQDGSLIVALGNGPKQD